MAGNETIKNFNVQPFLCLVVCSKGAAEGGFIEHAIGNSRGKGKRKRGNIGMRQMHHGDWRCIRTDAVGFVLKKYYGN